MATFPKAENDVLALATNMKNGLTDSPDVFPNPPVAPAALTTLINTFAAAQSGVDSSKSSLESAVNEKLAAMQNVIDALKKNIRYAETAVGNNEQQLKIIGWGPRKEKTPTPPPGQALELCAASQGEGWVELRWYSPVDGGRPAAYRVQKRLRPDGPWTDTATAIETQIRLEGQERLKEWEWRVIALNKAGEGIPSNVVMTVL